MFVFNERPSNIFRERKEGGFNLRIGDFGLSTKILVSEENEEMKNRNSVMTQNIGTPMYLAPELECGLNYNEKIDIYALGLILFELLFVISTRHEHDNLFKSLKLHHNFPLEMKVAYKEECRLIEWMTQREPEDRATVFEIMESKDFLYLEKEFSLSCSN